MAGFVIRACWRSGEIVPSKYVNTRMFQCGQIVLSQETKLEILENASEAVTYEEDSSREESDNIMVKRNKSGLAPQHRNIVHGKPPYEEPITSFHESISYRRRIFGRYGISSGIDPGILWPTREELQDKIDYEKVAYPDTLHEMIARAKLKKSKEIEAIKRREEEINAKAEKLEQWKRDLKQKIQKNLSEAQAAKAKKERLLEEVRQHFGFKVDHRDQRFKDLLEQKEKEEAKRAKAEKKKLKEARMLARLAGGSSPSAEASSPPEKVK
ncbi:growth arrest and DNA damage-inducible proteins-interacting protein 1 [Ischnura elegans]|uniref:growth arrest and DNA damage-inducible proteins-interacting protein 1 n=1 Tax=Ischnura elegans TaxID=197161 RepID=UPI001ED875E2|nr:growth arrest and DNA damage-inducible proteins-interacting protein 1 [Ischnura elegans]